MLQKWKFDSIFFMDKFKLATKHVKNHFGFQNDHEKGNILNFKTGTCLQVLHIQIIIGTA